MVNQPDSDRPTVDIAMICELSQEHHDSPFRATLVHEETRHWDDDPDPDVIDTIICTTEIPCHWRDVFAAINQWLHTTYGPGKTWVTDDQAPYGSLAEEYKFRISGQDFTSFTRTATVDGHPELQQWVANTYEAQKITQVNLNGDAWAKADPNELEGTLGGVTTGGVSGAGGVPSSAIGNR
ncbi:hypothetical protein CKJ76_24675 [Mycobacterium avium]|nr:hypothetical protein CKJ76_24675 [Mycobacterium avium]